MLEQGNEVLTLAFGHYSSHLATNFFNIQEATFSYNPNFSSGINHGVLFRENPRRSHLLTPRLILVDDENALGYLSQEGFYKENELDTNITENDPSVIYKRPSWGRNEFLSDFIREKQRIRNEATPCQDFLLKSSYDLSDNIKSWSDYVVPEFDEKTIITLPKKTEYYEDYENFTCFDSGSALWHKTNLSDEVEDNVRFFLEECDNLQGFQVLTDCDNGYAGISSGCTELLKDEYSKKDIIMVPSIYLDITTTEDVRMRQKKRCHRIYSIASSFSYYSEFCDIIAPVSHLYNPWSKVPKARVFRNINYKHEMMYHTSAILASAIDLFTLPYRLQHGSCNMHNLVSSMNVYGRCFNVVGINIPLPVKKNEGTLPSPELLLEGKFFESLTPMTEVSSDRTDIQSICSKGLGKNKLDESNKRTPVDYEALERDFKVYIQRFFPRTVTQVSSCKSVFRVPRTFPELLDNQYNLTNVEHEFGPLSEYITVGGLHNSKEMYNTLNNLHEEAKNIKKNGIPGFRPQDSDIEYDELFENLKTTTHAYENQGYL